MKINCLQRSFLCMLTTSTFLLCMVIIPTKGNSEVNTIQCVQAGQWKTPDDGSILSETQLLNYLNKRPVIMLGETHTSAEHHRWQLYVLSAMYGQNQNMVIGFEAFPRSTQPTLDRWVRGEISKDKFIELTRWNEVWGYDPDLYMPLFHFARMHRIPILALNVEHSLIQKISRYGLDSIPTDQRKGISTPIPPSKGYKQSLTNTFAMHGYTNNKGTTQNKTDNKKLSNFIKAQTFWDRAMAEAIAAARTSSNSPLVFAIVGSGHVEYGYGIPHQLEDLGISEGVVLLPWGKELSCDRLKSRKGISVAHVIFGIDTLSEQKKPYRPLLGVQIKNSANGVIIANVEDNSVAASGGIQKNDIIIQAAGIKVRKSRELITIISKQAPGTYLPLRVLREGKELVVIAKFPRRSKDKSLP